MSILDEKTLQAYAELSHLELVRDGQKARRVIRAEVLAALQELDLESHVLLDFCSKLKDYCYQEEPGLLNEGKFIRWLDLESVGKGKVELSKGAHLVGFTDTKDGLGLRVRNVRGGIYTVKAYKLVLFQRMTPEEMLVAAALDYINE